MYNIYKILERLNVSESALSKMIEVSQASLNQYKRAEYSNGYVGGKVERNLEEVFGKPFLEPFEDGRAHCVVSKDLKNSINEDDAEFLSEVEEAIDVLGMPVSRISKKSGYHKDSLAAAMRRARINGKGLSEELKRCVRKTIEEALKESVDTTDVEGVVVQFCKPPHQLSRPYVIRTNGIKTEVGDFVVVSTSGGLGVAKVFDFCTIRTPGSSYGVVQRVDIKQ